jgi:hypothetical protein
MDPSQLAQEDPAQIEELIKTNNIAALIKTDQATWEACLIKTGPNSYVMEEFGLPKQQSGVKQPEWVYKRRKFLKSLSVADRNLILPGDPAFLFDPVPYKIVYNFSYADTVKVHTHKVLPPLQPTPAAPQVPAPVPAQQVQAPQVPTLISVIEETSTVVQAESSKASESDLNDLPPLEDDSKPTSPDPPAIQPLQPQP